jgi:hypothetical protein
MLKTKNVTLLIVDVQGNLANLMHAKELLFRNIQQLIKGIQVLNIPILWAEQTPEKLGPTIPEISDHPGNFRPLSQYSTDP